MVERHESRLRFCPLVHILIIMNSPIWNIDILIKLTDQVARPHTHLSILNLFKIYQFRILSIVFYLVCAAIVFFSFFGYLRDTSFLTQRCHLKVRCMSSTGPTAKPLRAIIVQHPIYWILRLQCSNWRFVCDLLSAWIISGELRLLKMFLMLD